MSNARAARRANLSRGHCDPDCLLPMTTWEIWTIIPPHSNYWGMRCAPLLPTARPQTTWDKRPPSGHFAKVGKKEVPDGVQVAGHKRAFQVLFIEPPKSLTTKGAQASIHSVVSRQASS
jgi:hypothetical protein